MLLLPALGRAAPPEGFEQMRRDGVTFVHRPRHAGQARALARMFRPIAARLTRDLGLPRLEPVEVVVAQNPGDLQELSPRDPPPPPGAIGVAYPSRRLIVVSLSAGAQALPISLEALFTHELSHVALGQAVDGHAIPRWFAEGVAIRHSGELSWERLESLWGATIGDRLIPLDDLSRRFPVEDHGSSLAYAEAGDFVRFLGDEDRPSAIAELCARVRSGVPFTQALEANYATSRWELERQFFASLRKRFSVVPAITGVGAVWSIVAVLLILAWRRRRRHARAVMTRWEIEEQVADEQQRASALAAVGHIGLPDGAQVPALPPRLPTDEETGLKRIYYDGDYHTVH